MTREDRLPDLLGQVGDLIRRAGAPELFLTDPHGHGVERLVLAAEDYLGPAIPEEADELVLLRRACADYRAARRKEALRILDEDP